MPKSKAQNGEPLSFLKDVVNTLPHNCVIWPYGVSNSGYGAVNFNGKKMSAHRVALILFSGIDYPHLLACHQPVICHNRLCVNPLHLRWDTALGNSKDRILDKTSDNPTILGKLTSNDVESIRSDPRIHRLIAKDYGVSRVMVTCIKNRTRRNLV